MAWLLDWFKSSRQKSEACFQRGKQALDENDFDLAISWFNACIENDPTRATGFYGRGFAHLKKADYDRATDLFQHDAVAKKDMLTAENALAQAKAALEQYRVEYGRTAEPFEINALCTDVFDLDGFRRLAEAGVTELQVVPWYFTGEEAIKEKDRYQNSGIFHPFMRMPKFVLHDQKAIWTSPFHTSKSDAKWWAIWGGATVALVATDKYTAQHLPNTSGQVRLGTYTSNLGSAYVLVPMSAGFYFLGRAFHSDQLGPFCRDLATLANKQLVLPMNTGAEAVETAIKTARKWGYEVKGVPDGEAVIIVFDGNFHGRTTTIISFSTDPDARDDFGPYTPGFRVVPYGDLDALTAVVSELGERVVAVLVEPIQGEAGVVVPPPGFLAGIRSLCTENGILMIADEIQSGLGRTGYTFACAAEDVVPDAYLLGKALGGGIVPVSAMVSTWPVLGVLHPGQHGSTFGGNPLACAVGREVVAMLRTGEYQARARALGERLHGRLAGLPSSVVSSVRGRGLWAGLEFASLSGREVCERLAARGVLAKETHGTVIRLAPPLIISEDDLDWGLDRIEDAILA
jgi:ornithine--oxo-acid transaminase